MTGAARASLRRRCPLLVFLLPLLATPARAQESRATLLGTVTDGTGSSIAGARLIATNLRTDVRYSAESNSEGNYVIPYLAPGPYRLRIEHPGFRTYERGAIEVRIGDRLRVDVAMSVAMVAETLVVVGDTPLLESANTSLGSVVDSRRVADLPVAHGNAYHLIQLVAGVSYAGNATLDRPYDPTHIVSYAMGGAYALRNEITLDGSPNSSVTGGRSQNAAAYVPPADMIAEMRITTVALDASVGNTEGGVIDINLKSGSNSVHGTGYYNTERPEFFANWWLANKRGQPRADFNYHRWGASLTGPFSIPHLFSGKDRTFFSWGYEGIRERRPRTLGEQTVPTLAERAGDFSGLLAAGSQYQLYDPATRRRNPAGGLLADPFAGNLIPKWRISPIATNILGYFGLPNAEGTADGQNNFARADLAENVAYANHAWRVDHNMGERNRIFCTAAMYDRTSDYLNYFDSAATGEEFLFSARRATLDDVHVISSSAVANLRYAYNRFVRAADLNPASRGFDLTRLAPGNADWAAWNSHIDPPLRRFPLIDIAGYFNLVGTSGSGVLFRPQDTHSFSGGVSTIRGRHDLKFGTEYRVYRKADSNPYLPWSNGVAAGSSTGWLRFAGDWTKGPTDTSPAPPIGAGLASFLLGLPTGGGIDRRDSFAEQSSVSSFYFHDYWKPHRRLTLTLGLRYELEGPLTERFDRSVRGFDETAVLPIEGQVLANYAAIASLIPERPLSRFSVRGGVTFANVGGQPRLLYDRDTDNLMPRVGLAYRIDSQTLFRAGYGIFYGSTGIRRGDVYQTGFSLTTPLIASIDNGLSFQNTLANPFPGGAEKPAGASLGAMAGAGDQISHFNTEFAAPRLQRWQFSIQRELARRLLLEAAYVGNRGDQLETVRNRNGIPLEYLSRQFGRDQARIDYLGRQDIDNPFYSVLAPTTPLGATRKTGRGALLVPYPQFTRVETTTNEGYARYHALEARLEERFSTGHSIGVAYTWSKLMEATSYLNDMDPGPYYTISAADYARRFSASWIYELPFGRGRELGSGFANRWARVAGGWQIGGIYVYQSGPPLNFGNVSFFGNINDIRLASNQRTVERWFNTDAGFVRDSAQAPEFNVRTFQPRFSGLRGPAMNNWDLSILKNAPITERMKLQFRAEFLNAFNHAWFSVPNTTPTSTAFGTISSEQGYMRRVQLGVKLLY